MPSKDARKVLETENKLLEKLERQSADFANSNSGVAATIFNGWSGSFRAHREFNKELIENDDDSYFDARLDDERKLMKELRKVTRGKGSEVWRSWDALFKEEKDIIDELRGHSAKKR
jgi:hypothetical protein